MAGIDIGKAMVSVTVRVPSETRKGGRMQETREFGTTRRQLLALAGEYLKPGRARDDLPFYARTGEQQVDDDV